MQGNSAMAFEDDFDDVFIVRKDADKTMDNWNSKDESDAWKEFDSADPFLELKKGIPKIQPQTQGVNDNLFEEFDTDFPKQKGVTRSKSFGREAKVPSESQRRAVKRSNTMGGRRRSLDMCAAKSEERPSNSRRRSMEHQVTSKSRGVDRETSGRLGDFRRKTQRNQENGRSSSRSLLSTGSSVVSGGSTHSGSTASMSVFSSESESSGMSKSSRQGSRRGNLQRTSSRQSKKKVNETKASDDKAEGDMRGTSRSASRTRKHRMRNGDRPSVDVADGPVTKHEQNISKIAGALSKFASLADGQ